MKAWRRTSRVGSTVAAVAPATVLSVVTNGGTTVIWNFSTTVTSIGDPGFLAIEGDPGNTITSGLGSSSVHIDYGGSHGAGEGYFLDSASAGISFSPATTIADQSGTTT